MRYDEVALQLRGILDGYVLVGKLAESSGESVDHRFFIELRFHICAGFVDLLLCILADLNRFEIASNGGDLLNRQAHPIDCYHSFSPCLR